MLTLYDYLDSGNGYKIRLLLAQLGVRYRYVELDIMQGATRTPQFLAKNPNGRIPVLELEDGQTLAESDAILWYLGDGTAFVPEGRLARAQVLQWMFFEQYSHEPYVATPRFIVRHLPADSPRRAELPDRLRRAAAPGGDGIAPAQPPVSWLNAIALRTSPLRLHACGRRRWHQIADFPAICAWLARVAAQPGHLPLLQRPPG
jgi:glutathione S-transferase